MFNLNLDIMLDMIENLQIPEIDQEELLQIINENN